ncbi:MAG: septum formation initiator family protein [bacterium]
MAAGVGGPWGDHAPQRPSVGAGRIALKRRVTARGGNERRGALEAARRGMRRGPKGRLLQRVAEVDLPQPVKNALGEMARQSRLVQQKLLQRQKLKNVAIGLAAIWVVWMFILGDAGAPRLLWVKYENERLGREIERLAIENAHLQAEVSQLEGGGNEIVDRLAREEQAMVKDGEVLVRFYDPKGKKVPTAAQLAASKDDKGRGASGDDKSAAVNGEKRGAAADKDVKGAEDAKNAGDAKAAAGQAAAGAKTSGPSGAKASAQTAAKTSVQPAGKASSGSAAKAAGAKSGR